MLFLQIAKNIGKVFFKYGQFNVQLSKHRESNFQKTKKRHLGVDITSLNVQLLFNGPLEYNNRMFEKLRKEIQIQTKLPETEYYILRAHVVESSSNVMERSSVLIYSIFCFLSGCDLLTFFCAHESSIEGLRC